jgi:Concanavalin A-like lectin/glucanases superfamily/PA14 domain
MNIKYTHFFFLFFITTAFSQFVPNYYATLESNRPKGNKYLYYRLYSTSASAFPANAAEFETNFANAANFKLAGYVALTSNAGNLNTSSNYTANLINFLSQTDLKNAIGNQTPYSGFNGDGFTIVVSGYFIPKQTGTYTFTIEGDDAVDLFINDQNVANHYGPHGNSVIGTHSGTIALIAGKKYLFRARMQEGGGGEVMQLFWKKPSEASGSVWYQDIEELSGEEAVPNGLVLSVDPGNWYTYPKYGTTVTDLKGNATGTFGGDVTLSSTAGGTFLLDGNADYIDFGKSPTNFPTGDISVFIWVKAISLRANWNIFFSKWFSDATGNSNGSDMHYDLFNNGSATYQHLYTTNKSEMSGTRPLSANTWYHVGFTISNGNLQMYLNGDLDGGVITGAARSNAINDNLWLGDARTNGLVTLYGYIGSTLIYNRAITQEEVFQNYNATKHKYGL